MLDYFLEGLVDIVVVVLGLEVRGYFRSAEWALSGVGQMTSHALNAKAMHAWQDTGLNHQIEAHAAICFNLFILLLIEFLEKSMHMTLNLVEFLIGLFFIFIVEGSLRISDCLLMLRLRHFSVLVGVHGLWSVLFVEEDDLDFNPVPGRLSLRFPLFDNLLFHDLVVVLFELLVHSLALFLVLGARVLQ